MAVATFTKYNSFIDELSKGGHNFSTPPTLKLALTNTAPGAADTVWNTTVAPAPAAANNYPSGGNTLTGVVGTTTTGVFKLVAADTVFTATAGGIGPFRYVILYNTNTTPANKVIGYYDNAASITLADTDTFTWDADPTNGLFTIA